eukprot:3992224-Alexandrium_andersonii.AAC.1
MPLPPARPCPLERGPAQTGTVTPAPTRTPALGPTPVWALRRVRLEAWRTAGLRPQGGAPPARAEPPRA